MAIDDIRDLHMALKKTIAEVGKDKQMDPSDMLGAMCLTMASLIEFLASQTRVPRTKDELWTAAQAMVEIALDDPDKINIDPLDLN